MCDYDNNYIQNIDLVYTYTENYLQNRRSEFSSMRSRQGTFLGFAGLLLRFNLDLSDSQPSYLLTKIGALVTSFCSVFILGWALRAFVVGYFVFPSFLIQDDLNSQNVEIKLSILSKHTKACEDLSLALLEQKKLLNQAIIFMVFSVFFFTVNGVLVSFFGK
jgi:hypothetical protein